MTKQSPIILPSYLNGKEEKVNGIALLRFAHSCVYSNGEVVARSSYPIKPNDFQTSENFKEEVQKRFEAAGFRVIWEA